MADANSSPRTLIYDIETSLQLAAIFQLKNNDWINPESLVSERHVLSICWKWLGEPKVYSVSILDDPKRFSKDPHDDKHVLATFYKVLEQADCIVAHNGDQFDYKYLMTRFLVHGMPALPPITSVDTYKVAKQKFMFNSNKLDYVGGLLKVGRKKPTTSGLWMKALQGDKKAIREMVEYNKQDVLLLERVFLKLRPFVQAHINRELFGKTGCPRCGSKKVQSRGFHRAISRIYRRWQCQACSGWFKSATNEKDLKTKSRVI